METFLEYGLPVVGVVLGLMVTYGISYLVSKAKLNKAEEEAVRGLGGAVMSVYHSYVKRAKQKNKDGGGTRSLTPEEALIARNEAKAIALAQLKGAALNVYKNLMTDGRKDYLIEKALNLFKKDAKEAKK